MELLDRPLVDAGGGQANHVALPGAPWRHVRMTWRQHRVAFLLNILLAGGGHADHVALLRAWSGTAARAHDDVCGAVHSTMVNYIEHTRLTALKHHTVSRRYFSPSTLDAAAEMLATV